MSYEVAGSRSQEEVAARLADSLALPEMLIDDLLTKLGDFRTSLDVLESVHLLSLVGSDEDSFSVHMFHIPKPEDDWQEVVKSFSLHYTNGEREQLDREEMGRVFAAVVYFADNEVMDHAACGLTAALWSDDQLRGALLKAQPLHDKLAFIYVKQEDEEVLTCYASVVSAVFTVPKGKFN